MPSSKYFIGPILLNLIFRNSVIAKGQSQDLYEEDPGGFLSVVIIGYTSSLFCLVGTLYVLIRIYYRWSNTNKNLSIALRVPFYMGLFNALLLVCQNINLTYVTVKSTTLPEPYCREIAAVQVIFTFYHRLVIVGISIITYLRVCKNKPYNTGRYDWKITIPSAVISVFLSVFGLKNLGPDRYWCSLKTDLTNVFVPLTSTLLTILLLIVCLFCYIKTIYAIRFVKRQQKTVSVRKGVIDKNSSSTSPIVEMERKVTKKVMGYILVFILQWAPALPYNVYKIFGTAEPWAYCLVIASINLGGVGNAIFYVINEGWEMNNYSTGKSLSNFDQDNVADSKDDSNDTISSKDVSDISTRSILLRKNNITAISEHDIENSVLENDSDLIKEDKFLEISSSYDR
ncbi:22496_t:CDS:2 [Gigaspora margarita]|uniref:22496_t:CDS:1 n=1 Tax=Gigaspora margarita TaxID=4874 RepID=A0ABN7V125_GIGMA|nr:22496_t:CDS:2 [Gigaspora margarita]